MTDASADSPDQDDKSLDVGKVIIDVFLVYLKGFVAFYLLAFVMTFIQSVVATQLIGVFAGELNSTSVDMQRTTLIAAAANIPVWLTFLFVNSGMVHCAIQLRIGQRLNFMDAVLAALRSYPVILAVFAIITVPYIFISFGLLFFMGQTPALAGFMFLLAPIFMVIATVLLVLFYVFVPVMLWERKRFRSIGRALELTRGYRGAIFGQFIIVAIIVSITGMILGTLVFLVFGRELAGGLDQILTANEMALPWWYSVLSAATNALTLPLTIIPTAIVYVRLIEIKGGGSKEKLQTIFE